MGGKQGKEDLQVKMEGLRIKESIVFKCEHVLAMHFDADNEKRLMTEQVLSSNGET